MSSHEGSKGKHIVLVEPFADIDDPAPLVSCINIVRSMSLLFTFQNKILNKIYN